jgi:hypothetical protein
MAITIPNWDSDEDAVEGLIAIGIIGDIAEAMSDEEWLDAFLCDEDYEEEEGE